MRILCLAVCDLLDEKTVKLGRSEPDYSNGINAINLKDTETKGKPSFFSQNPFELIKQKMTQLETVDDNNPLDRLDEYLKGLEQLKTNN